MLQYRSEEIRAVLQARHPRTRSGSYVGAADLPSVIVLSVMPFCQLPHAKPKNMHFRHRYSDQVRDCGI